MTARAIAVLVFLMGTTPPSAHVGDIVYPIYELPSSDLPDIHDGSIEDWEDALVGPTVTHADLYSGYAVDDIIDPSSLALRVFLAWHKESQRIYFGIERFDDLHYSRGAATGEDVRPYHETIDSSEFCIATLRWRSQRRTVSGKGIASCSVSRRV